MRDMKTAAVFLDRDGTLIEDRGDLRDPSQVVFFPETFAALRMLQKDYLLFVITNQSGVGKGTIKRAEADRVNESLVAALSQEGIEIAAVYTCPHQRGDGCCCIKPQPHFLHKAAREFGIDLRRSFTVGDHPHDIELAKNVGARGIYVLTGHGQKHVGELPDGVQVVAGIMQAAERIVSSRWASDSPGAARIE